MPGGLDHDLRRYQAVDRETLGYRRFAQGADRTAPRYSAGLR
jgi:hypothetical protein